MLHLILVWPIRLYNRGRYVGAADVDGRGVAAFSRAKVERKFDLRSGIRHAAVNEPRSAPKGLIALSCEKPFRGGILQPPAFKNEKFRLPHQPRREEKVNGPFRSQSICALKWCFDVQQRNRYRLLSVHVQLWQQRRDFLRGYFAPACR